MDDVFEGFVPWPEDFAQRYRDAGYWRGETFDEYLRRLTSEAGARMAVIDSRYQLSYSDLESRVGRMAFGFVEAGLRRGQAVVLQLPNRVEFVIAFFALQRLGVVPILALPSHRSNEILHFCRIARAAAYVVGRDGDGDQRAVVDEIRRELPTLPVLRVEELESRRTTVLEAPLECSTPRPSDVAVLLVSGGTTGLPKLIPRTHDDYLYNARAAAEFISLSEEDVYLAALPAAHNFTLACPGIIGTLGAHGTVVLSGSAAPDEAFELIERHGVTVTALVPPAARIWAEATEWLDESLATLRLMQVGGARLLPEHAQQVRSVFGPILQQVFGMAEGLLNMTEIDAPDDIVDSTQGRPLSPADEIRIVDDDDDDLPVGGVGQLLTRGPYTLRGYLRAPEHNAISFTEDGFYRSGDLVRLAPTGHLVVEGRVKDQINRGGEKIAAAEVEELLVGHPDIADVAVVGLPDDMLGERICAFVILEDEAGDITRGEVSACLSAKGLASFKIPDEVRPVSAFPLTAVGKTDKRALTLMASEGVGDER